MKVLIITTNNFKKEAKKLIKKYRSLKDELIELSQALKINPELGVKITEDTYKIRLAVKSKGKGKSGGIRIITYLFFQIENKLTKVYLLSIYDKSDSDNIPDKVLKTLIKNLQSDFDEEE